MARPKNTSVMARLDSTPPPIDIHVRRVTQFAFNAGLTARLAQQIIVESPDWRHPELPCAWVAGPQSGVAQPSTEPCGRHTHVIVDRGWQDRAILYCTGCGTVDLWV